MVTLVQLLGDDPVCICSDGWDVPIPSSRLQIGLACGDIQAHRTLAATPDAADLVRVARVQALLANATGIVLDASVLTGALDRGFFAELGLAVEAASQGCNRLATLCQKLADPAGRIDSALVHAAGRSVPLRSGPPTEQPRQLLSRLNLPKTAGALLGGLASLFDVAYLTVEVAADHVGLTAPARVIDRAKLKSSWPRTGPAPYPRTTPG